MKEWLRERVYSGALGPTRDGSRVVVAGWLQELRNLGGIAFLQLRDREGTVQLTLVKKENRELFKRLTTLNRESVVAAACVLRANPEAPRGFELIPQEVEVISEAAAPLPMGVVDRVGVELDTRLTSRFIDLRRPESSAVFKIRASMLAGIRETLEREGFIEVHTPKLVATATEGGTALFQVQYFERKAFLNQSPQLYKQMLMATGLDRVYEIGPAFRAEEHDTVRHLNEFTSVDAELAFADEEDAMGVLERCLAGAIQRVLEERGRELETLRVSLDKPSVPLPRLPYSKCARLAEEAGAALEPDGDLGMEALRAVGEQQRGFYFITRWPAALKPFYALPFDEKPDETR
ncbi:MAG: aspartate--tRNA(Asn) ligase, partial [Thermoplasmata archaeon]